MMVAIMLAAELVQLSLVLKLVLGKQTVSQLLELQMLR